MLNHFQFPQLNFTLGCLILVFFFPACNYDPDDEYYADIDFPSHVTSISLNDQDTIISMWSITNCIYVFSSTPDLKVSTVNVYIDGNLVVSSSSSRVEFTIDPNQFAEGNHVITITTTTNTGSGSLADRIGAEGLYFEKEWVLVIEHHIPVYHYLFMREIINENGLLKVSWDKFNERDFQKYELFSTPTLSEGEFLNFASVASIFDSSRNYFYDSSYVGGLRAYHVMLKAGDGFFGGYMDMVETINYPFPVILEAQPQGLNLQVTFSKCLFPAAFKEYRLSISPDEYNEDIEIGIISNVNDTTFIIHDLSFGSTFTVKLATYPVNIDYDISNKKYEPTSKFQSHIGDASFEYYLTDATTTGDIYFMKYNDGGSIYMFSGGVVKEILHNNDDLYFNNSFHISEDGKYIVYRDHRNDKVSLYTLPEMTKISETGDLNMSRGSRISNNGLIPVFTAHELMIYDFFQDKIIDTLYTNYTGIYQGGIYYGADSYISPDGEYLYVRTGNYYSDSIYHRAEGNNYIPGGALHPNALYMGFNPMENGEIIYDENYNQHNIKVLNYENMTVTRTLTNLQPPFSNIDPVTGNFLALDNVEENIFGLYSGSDGSRLGSIKIAYNVSIESMLLVNSVLYSANGYKMQVLP